MTTLERIEDAFLEALEDGRNPPFEFTVYLPWDTILDLKDTERTVKLLGYIHIEPDGLQGFQYTH